MAETFAGHKDIKFEVGSVNGSGTFACVEWKMSGTRTGTNSTVPPSPIGSITRANGVTLMVRTVSW
jgi:hypothetical protein